MEFFRIKKDIPFMSHALTFNVISLVTFLLAVVFLVWKGLNFGVDFTGGTVMELGYAKSADLAPVRKILDDMKLGEVSVQAIDGDRNVLIRTPLKAGTNNAEFSNQIFKNICGTLPMNDARTGCGAGADSIQLKRVEFVGPQVGKELFQDGALAMLLVIAGIVIYLAIRFEWRFAISAIIANLHDVVIILGLFALFQWEFNLPVLAAVLAVLGYSVNESVVIADRIRENFRKMRRAEVKTVIDNAITTTLSRTVITHLCTLIMVLSMFFLGGETLHYFSLALAIGICFGIYSSALVMAALVMWFGVSRENLVKPEIAPKDALEAEKILP